MMQRMTLTLWACLAAPAFAQQPVSRPPATPPVATTAATADLRAVAPALEKYQRDVLAGSLWQRPGLSPRERSLVTLAVVVARNQGAELPGQLNRALDNGVTPREIGELITHLAFYAGWGDAMAAVAATRQVYAARGIGPEQLPAVSPPLLPINVEAEAKRVEMVRQSAGAVSPGLEQYTTDVLFTDLWLRPELAPRDRSLVTISALMAVGQTAQLTGHLNIGINNGLTRPQIAEVITQIAFYAGWPKAFSAVPVVAAVYASRDKKE
jgi:4-carboxymuconolactone decarboxylase